MTKVIYFCLKTTPIFQNVIVVHANFILLTFTVLLVLHFSLYLLYSHAVTKKMNLVEIL